ncbi:MAG: protein-disulfide reductase DsbD N-terminal domain-containing protein [Acidobacteriota bacterium]
MYRSVLGITLFIIFFSSAVFAQNPAKWGLSSDAKDKTLEAGEAFKAALKADIESGWHLYALEQPEGGPIATTIKVTEGKPFDISGKIESPKPIVKEDGLFTGTDGKPLQTKFFTDAATFNIPLKATTEIGASELSLDVRFQLCNDTFCLPPRIVRVTFSGSEDVKKTVGSQQTTVSPEQTTSTTSAKSAPSALPRSRR